MTNSLPRSMITKLAGGALLAAAALSLAACETTGAGSIVPVAAAAPASPTQPEPAPASNGPMTHQKAALYCWMATEHGRKDLPLNKRADIVDQCIKKKMAGG